MLVSDVMPVPKDAPTWTSFSSITTHRECPQRWSYRYLLGLSAMPDPEDAKVELNFGIWWHGLRAADAIERGVKAGSLLEMPKRLSLPDGAEPLDVKATLDQGLPLVYSIRTMAANWWANLPDEHQELWVSKLGEPLEARLHALDIRWHDEYDEELDARPPLLVEVKWVRRLPGTEVDALGYVDEVYLDRRRNLVVVEDRKTAKQLSAQSAKDDMMQSQLPFYAWGLSPKLMEHGLRPQALSYDRVKSVKATTPKLNQSGTLSKTVTQFDLRTYREWVAAGQNYVGTRKDGSAGGTYELDPVLEAHLSTPQWRAMWFDRTLVPINRHLVRAHLQAAIDSLGDMDQTADRFARRKFASRNLGAACRWCDYGDLCRAQMLGGPEGEYPLGDFGLTASR